MTPESDPHTITLDRYVAEWLVEHALNELYLADQDDGCCAGCCAPCAAVDRLLQAGQLDDLVRNRALGSDWWDEANDQVDRAWLMHAWRMVACHVA